MEKRYILGIDQGSTGSKVIVVDDGGNVVCSAYRKIKSFFPEDGWLEHDPVDLWQSVEESLIEVSEKFDMSQIRGIGITNQRETTILWDKESGEPLTKAISWQCTRSQPIIDRWAGFADEILDTTGLISNPYFSASKTACSSLSPSIMLISPIMSLLRAFSMNSAKSSEGLT